MKNESVKKNRKMSIMLLLVLFAGLSLLLYPTVSEYWNKLHQSGAIASYVESVTGLTDDEYENLWKEASAYNKAIPREEVRFYPTETEKEIYDHLLNISDNGIMGYVEIPKIDVALPIYHGINDDILQTAIGHIEGSSLPVGGVGTHCVISGHRGLPSAKLFTDLDQLTEGDIFMLRILDEILTYEVDQIHIVEPDDISFLSIEEDKDLCTLVTCTPYGVNSHRLLVRGHRIENQGDMYSMRVTADAIQIDPKIVAPMIAAPVVIIFLLRIFFYPAGRKRK